MNFTLIFRLCKHCCSSIEFREKLERPCCCDFSHKDCGDDDDDGTDAVNDDGNKLLRSTAALQLTRVEW